MRIVMAACLAVFLASACGCVSNPATGANELRLISTLEELEMGKRLDAQVRSQYKAVTGTPQAERAARIGTKLAAVSDRKDVSYQFALIESADLNAFAAPGGFIYVTTALEKLAEDDAELGAVIGHEIAHVAARHSVNQVQRALGYEIVSSLILGDAKSADARQAADIAFDTVVMTGYSRKDESQADELGIKYAARAGFDPYGMARFFARLEERQQQGVMDPMFEFMMSHPNIAERRQKAQALAARYTARKK